MKKAITPTEAARTYGISKGTLANLRCKKKGPAYFKVGKKILYRVSAFESWLFQNPVQTIDSIS